MATRRSLIIKAAREALERAGATRLPIDVRRVAEIHGIDVREEANGGEISGFLLRKDGKSIIGVNNSHSPNRRRFTIAHELGHYFLHQFEGLHLDKTFHRSGLSSLGISTEEIEANAFAAELLMPDHLVRKAVAGFEGDLISDSGIEQLAESFQVSSQAMSIRLANLGFISL